MRAQASFWLIVLVPALAAAAEPDKPKKAGADQRAGASELLGEKLAEAESLHSEIERLRNLAGKPRTNFRLRVRIIEASLSEVKRIGISWPPNGAGEAKEIDEQLTALLSNRSAAKLVGDETLTAGDGATARLRVGAETPASELSKVNADRDQFAFRGTEIVATPKLKADGRLAVEIVCKQLDPILYSKKGPQLRIHELSTAIELAPDAAVVLDGAKQERVESESRGFSKSGLDISFETHTVHQIQTFVIVCRESATAR